MFPNLKLFSAAYTVGFIGFAHDVSPLDPMFYSQRYHRNNVPGYRQNISIMLVCMVQKSEDESKKENDFWSNIDIEKLNEYASTSDEIALLATRAYLKRKHKVEWHQKQSRRAKQLKSLGIPQLDGLESSSWNMRPVVDSNINHEGIWYFWENPTELKYLRTGRARLDFEGIISDGLDSEMLEEVDSQYDPNIDSNIALHESDEEEDSMLDFDDEGVFTSFPQAPPTQHERQSLPRKKLFQDPKWKAKWYRARWAEKASLSESELKQEKRRKRIEKLIQGIPTQFLQSLQLESLTDEEIEDAIRTYIITNQRKSRSMIRVYELRKKLIQLKNKTKENDFENRPIDNKNEKNLLLTSFMIHSPADEQESKRLLEEKKKRSERAKKAYGSRLINIESKRLSKDSDKVILPQKTLDSTPVMKKAVDRIEDALVSGDVPDIQDVRSLLKPQRLPGRKKLLLRVLNQSFGLRGRCVPTFGGSKEDLEKFYFEASTSDIQTCKKNFATSSSLKELGMFVLHLLRK